MLQLANVDEKENQINKLICSMEQGVQFSKLKKRGGGGQNFPIKRDGLVVQKRSISN